MNFFGLWPPPQNSSSSLLPLGGDLTTLGPVAKGMWPPKFVLVLVEEVRITSRSYVEVPSPTLKVIAAPGCSPCYGG